MWQTVSLFEVFPRPGVGGDGLHRLMHKHRQKSNRTRSWCGQRRLSSACFLCAQPLKLVIMMLSRAVAVFSVDQQKSRSSNLLKAVFRRF